MKIYVFGYGSLMNRRSLQKTLPDKKIERWVSLVGYQRKFNAPVGGYLYLNLVPEINSIVEGVLIRVTDEELKKLKKREIGYRCVDVVRNIKESIRGRIFTFIAPNKDYPEMKILKSYIDTCFLELPPHKRKKWLEEAIINNQIEDDTSLPKYKNVDLSGMGNNH